MDTQAAKAAPGVLAVITAKQAGTLGKGERNAATLLGGPEIEHYHQAIALVVADTFEQARAASALIQVSYQRQQGEWDLDEAKSKVTTPPRILRIKTSAILQRRLPGVRINWMPPTRRRIKATWPWSRMHQPPSGKAKS